jgi:uncharacterized protein YbjT (DUF2867 family)
MRIAVAGATGNIGARTVSALERDGHEAIRISRSLAVDLTTGDGLDAALEGVDAVVDAISAPPTNRDETLAYFGATTRNLLAAEEHAGVRHHVLLSIVGIHRLEGNAHYTGKREQERLIAEGTVPWTIVAPCHPSWPVSLCGTACFTSRWAEEIIVTVTNWAAATRPDWSIDSQ